MADNTNDHVDQALNLSKMSIKSENKTGKREDYLGKSFIIKSLNIFP